jgi:tyrosine recombinase xerC
MRASMVKILILIGFSLGDRIGETRALTFDCFDEKLGIVKIKHSINYDKEDEKFLSDTKNYPSQRDVNITKKLISEVKNYQKFLIENTNYTIDNKNIIFFNYERKKPYSDTNLRKKFTYYCNKANVTKIRMYDLRHTYVATMMGEGKELYLISSRIGHINYSTTVNKYGHLSNKVKREMASATDKYI